MITGHHEVNKNYCNIQETTFDSSASLNEQMDIEMEEELNQLDRYLQYSYTNWPLENSNAINTENFNMHTSSVRNSYENCSYHKQIYRNQENYYDYDKNLMYHNQFPNGLEYQNHLTWSNQIQYFPTYQQYLPHRDTEKTYACSNI